MSSSIGIIAGALVGAVMGMREGFEAGVKAGKTGSIICDVITVPIGAATGAVIGTCAGTVAGVYDTVRHDYKVVKRSERVEWKLKENVDGVCDVMDEDPWCEDLVRPVARVTNAAAMDASCVALEGDAAFAVGVLPAVSASGIVAGAAVGVAKEINDLSKD